MTTLLSEAQATRLRHADLTYDGVGTTRSDDPPSAYRNFSRSRLLSDVTFDQAAELLMTWQVHERSGLRVAASSLRVAKDEVVEMRLGMGPASLRIPCRVVLTDEGPDLAGFAYGTLPGHPESGEEFFMVERDLHGVRMTVRAFSRPASTLARLAGPLGSWLQEAMTTRYLRAANGG